MNKGNTVRRLNSELTPNQPTTQPEGKEDDLLTGQKQTSIRYG